MKVYFYECGIWTGTNSLWHGLGLEGRMKQARSEKGPGPFVVSLAGVGGKTSAIRRLAWEALDRGLKVLVATTTHMACPDAFGCLEGNVEEIRAGLEQRGLAVAGRPAENGKIAFTGRELYEEACSLADLVLVEADGSRRLPLKVPRAGEPVIPEYRYDSVPQWPDIPWETGRGMLPETGGSPGPDEPPRPEIVWA